MTLYNSFKKFIHSFAGRFFISLAVAVCIYPVNLQTVKQQSANAFSIGEEKEVGRKLLSIVHKEFDLLDDPDIVQYVTEIGRDILKIAGTQYFDYHFFIIRSKEFNAFAAPSGLIFINTGLIDAMENEGELIGVLAHECGHVTSRHIAERLEKSKKINIGTLAMAMAAIAVGGGPLAEALLAGSLAAGATMNLKFSREDEEEADRLAFNWMQEMDRDPADMLGMLKKMRKLTVLNMGEVPQYLLTHPHPEKRMDYVQDLLLVKKDGTYPDDADFDFQRIKYRVLAKTKDTAQVLPLLHKKAQDIDLDKTDSISDIMVHYGISQLYLENGDYAKARTHLSQVVAKLPDKDILQTDLGILYNLEGETDKAMTLFRRALQNNPDCIYTAFHLARLLEKKGESTQAVGLYEKVLEKMPAYSMIYYHMGRAVSASGKENEAHYYMGMYSWFEDDPKVARYHFNKAIETLPGENELRKKSQKTLERIDEME